MDKIVDFALKRVFQKTKGAEKFSDSREGLLPKYFL